MPKPLILAYHSIDHSGSVISETPESFALQMNHLAASGRRVVPLTEIVQSPGAVALTFDDAYRNFSTHALPILQQFRFPCTLFVVPRRCGLDNQWPGQAPQIPAMPLMSWEEIKEAARLGITVGSHTMDHPDLTRLCPAAAAAQMGEAKDRIEQNLGTCSTEFAYPYGAVNRQVRDIAAGSFSLACSTRLAAIGPATDLLQLPRVDAYYLRHPAIFRLVLEGKPSNSYLTLRRTLREWKGRLQQ